MKNTYDKILDASLKEIANDGIKGFRLNDVAEAVGIKAPSIYAFFKSREILIEKSLEMAENKFKEVNISLDLNDEAPSLLYSLFKTYIEIFENETLQNYYKILRKESLSNKHIASLYQNFAYTIETQSRFIVEEKLNIDSDDEIRDKKLSLLSLIFRDSLLSMLFTFLTESKESALWEAERISSLIVSLL